MLNYIVNAIKFTEAGTVTVRVALDEETTDSALVRFEVRDTGIGIDADDLPRLFSAFEQADNSSTRRYCGTGLGLAITRRLARLMGGDAGAESILGAGSTFWFTVRLKKTTVTHSVDGDAGLEDAESALRTRHAGKRMLIVEDDPVSCEVVRTLLEETKLSIDTTENGIDAVEQASKQCFDIILMDLQLPLLGGVEATQRIRKLPGYADVPILAVTATAFAEDRKSCLASGMNDFVAKPVDPEELCSARCCAGWSGAAADRIPRRARRSHSLRVARRATKRALAVSRRETGEWNSGSAWRAARCGGPCPES